MNTRGAFSRMGFVLAAAGSAVGLGNIWRFPYLAGENGGAAFVVIYILCSFVICYPLMIGEVSIGRATQTDAYGAYRKLGGKAWSLLGLYGILCGFLILSFYNVVAGWAFGYFIEIAFGNLLTQPDKGAFFSDFTSTIGLNFIFSLSFMAVTAFIVARGIAAGIEAANKVMMPLLFLILLVIIGFGLTLPNAWAGIEFYLVPQLSEVKLSTFYAAIGQAFFSLSLGMGGLITYGSYVSKQQNIVRSSAAVAATDLSVAFLSGLMVFPLVFSQGLSPAEGPPLVFIVLPEVFASMGPLIGRLVGGAFFLLLCFAALTSTISLLEVPVTYFIDQHKSKRTFIAWVLALVIFVIGLPSMLSFGAVEFFTHLPFYSGKPALAFVSEIFSDVSLPLGGCLMAIFIATRWKRENFNREIREGAPGLQHSRLEGAINIVLAYIAPPLLGALTVMLVLEKIFGTSLF